jgi:hypothetical protein
VQLGGFSAAGGVAPTAGGAVLVGATSASSAATNPSFTG